jgi:hypothetical protein
MKKVWLCENEQARWFEFEEPTDMPSEVTVTMLTETEQPAQQEWSNVTDDALMEEVRRRGFVIRDAQVGHKWVGLTDDELEELEVSSVDRKWGHLDASLLSRAIEAKLKEKNNG